MAVTVHLRGVRTEQAAPTYVVTAPIIQPNHAAALNKTMAAAPGTALPQRHLRRP